MHKHEGATGSQTPPAAGPEAAHRTTIRNESTAAPRRLLLSDREAATALGVGSRTFAEMIATADWLPAPIVFGPRLRRWDAEELLSAARTRAPRGDRRGEPAQLARARIERMKAAGGAAAGVMA